jgi:hypothetical protein
VLAIHPRIVTSLGGQPLVHHATLAPQAADTLAAGKASSTNPQPALPLLQSRQTEHHTDNSNTNDAAGTG